MHAWPCPVAPNPAAVPGPLRTGRRGGRLTLGSLRGLVVAGLLAGGLPACTLVQLRQDAQAFYAATVLAGRVECPPGWRGPVIVAAVARAERPQRLVHQTLLHECGGYELIVPRGEYAVVGFGDGNANFVFDAGEPSGRYGAAAPVAAPGTGLVAGLDFVIAPAAATAPALAVGTAFDLADAPRHSVQAGALADLQADRFSAASGERGYWSPMQAFRTGNGNVHFLEPYDPGRTPVLFVHGAAGSPQDWRAFFDRLDRSRYQAWFFQYPSGASIDSMAHLLYWKLLNLQLRHRFDDLVLVAHSMGGLVARDFLVGFGDQFPQIRTFVSLSTPWGGEAAAELGVKHSPAVVPSWVDMQPEGRFMAALFKRPLPPHVAHHLFFGHRGGYSLLRPNNDGTVTLASQLRSAAQAEARMVVGFDEDHVGILRSPQVLRQFQAVLDGAADARRRGPPPGQVQLGLRFEGRPDGPGPQPSLWLTPVAPQAGASAPAGLAIALSADDGSRRVGPIPPGDYDAAVVAAAYRSEPARRRVRIDAGQAPAVDFVLRPQGTLWGYVGAAVEPVDSPAGSFRAPHPDPRIERITLTGAGLSRTLLPRRDGDRDLLRAYAEGRDDAVGAQFSFVGLPAGDYELTIEAQGHRPHRSRHAVRPGQPSPVLPVVLTPLR